MVPGDVVVDGNGVVRTITQRTPDGLVRWIVGALPDVHHATVEAQIGIGRGLDTTHEDNLGPLLVLHEPGGPSLGGFA